MEFLWDQILPHCFASLFLLYSENNWFKKIKITDIGRARHFGNNVRFIDGLTAINDCAEFERHFQEIYPTKSNLKK